MSDRVLIQELGKTDPPPWLVAMIGYVLAQDLRELKATGTLDIDQKPLDMNTLTRATPQALDTC